MAFLQRTVAALVAECVPTIGAVRLFLLPVGWVVSSLALIAEWPHQAYVALIPYCKFLVEVYTSDARHIIAVAAHQSDPLGV